MLVLSPKWASLVAQMADNLPVMQEAGVQPLGQEGPLEKGMTTHSSILAWRIPWTEEWAAIHGVAKNQIRLNDKHTHKHVSKVSRIQSFTSIHTW